MDALRNRALGHLRNAKPFLSRQQFLTLRGQILGGDPEGAMKGLERLKQKVRGSGHREITK